MAAVSRKVVANKPPFALHTPISPLFSFFSFIFAILLSPSKSIILHYIYIIHYCVTFFYFMSCTGSKSVCCKTSLLQTMTLFCKPSESSGWASLLPTGRSCSSSNDPYHLDCHLLHIRGFSRKHYFCKLSISSPRAGIV